MREELTEDCEEREDADDCDNCEESDDRELLLLDDTDDLEEVLLLDELDELLTGHAGASFIISSGVQGVQAFPCTSRHVNEPGPHDLRQYPSPAELMWQFGRQPVERHAPQPVPCAVQDALEDCCAAADDREDADDLLEVLERDDADDREEPEDLLDAPLEPDEAALDDREEGALLVADEAAGEDPPPQSLGSTQEPPLQVFWQEGLAPQETPSCLLLVSQAPVCGLQVLF